MPGWRRLHLTFHLLFIGAILGLAALAIWTDLRGYEQTRATLAAQAKYSADLFLKELESPEGQVVLANLNFSSEAHELRPTLTSARIRVMRAAMPDDYAIGKACYLTFRVQDKESLTVCAAIDHSTSAVTNPGRFLYVIVRFTSDTITPHQGFGSPVTAGDYFRLEVKRASGNQQRWLLALDNFSKQALIDAQGYARDERIDPESYQITAYPADDRWAVSDLFARRSDHHVKGSFATGSAPSHERLLAIAIDMTSLVGPNESWPIQNGSALVRIAHYRGDAEGENPELRGATYSQQGDQVQDLVGMPLVSARALYSSPGLGETVSLFRRGDEPAMWIDHFEREAKLDAAAYQWPLWRDRWFNTAPITTTSRIERVPDYEVRTSVPAAVAISTWNRFAPKLALSFVAVLAVVIVLYGVTMRAVLSRLMKLAASASATTVGAGLAPLPYENARDELGLLSRTLTGLIAKVREDSARREQETQDRLKREYETLRVIGHHIRSPIQALLALNPPESRSWSYIDRINKAVQAIFGGDALRDAFNRMYGEPVRIDLSEFLAQLTSNAAQIGIQAVEFKSAGKRVAVDVDDGALSDSLVQILNNANAYRTSGTAIVIALDTMDGKAVISIQNTGPTIPEAWLEDIFKFGVSVHPTSSGNQGQGLFVARELVAKMGGTVVARNLDQGVSIEIVIPVASDTSL
jgi:signal transduction histidine kinase